MAAVDISEFRRRMDSAMDVLKKELSGLRTGRASPSLLDPVLVDAYGQKTPIPRLANISVPEPRQLTIQVWDRGLVTSVEKAIREANLGLNPQSDGQVIRLHIPALTQERRQELVKVAGKYAEQARVSVRNVRRDAMEMLKKAEKDHKISQDEHRVQSAEVQKITDDHIKQIDAGLATKEKEIMQV
ncbi:MAG: ribosome recycling factor [Alphaproteobacteria bacterium]